MEKFDCRNDIIYLIRHLSKLLQADFEMRVAEAGLTAAQARVLLFIGRKTNVDNIEVHQNDVQNEFALAKSTVNGLISRLEKNDFVKRENVKNHVNLTLTEKGNNTISQIRDGRIATINKLFENQSEEQKQKILTELNQLINNLEGGN